MIHIWCEAPRIEDDAVVVSAILEGPAEKHPLWYRLPIQWKDWLTDSADPFVIAAVQWGMKRRLPMVVHGAVSPSLLANLDEWQSAWMCLRPEEYGHIEIRPEQLKETPRAEEPAAVAAFSGGVDSSYTLWRHHRRLRTAWSPPIKAGLMVHGFDIPLERPEAFKVAADKARQLLGDVNADFVEMATNFRSIPIDWEDCAGAAVSAAMALLQRRFTVGLIGASKRYDEMRGKGRLHSLLSSDAMKIVGDGSDASRIGKVQALTEWPAAMRLLRVCWAGPETEKNCCKCEKCIRTILEFRAVTGKLPPAFESDVTDEQLRHLLVFGRSRQLYLEQAAHVARSRGEKGQWLALLERCVRRSRHIEAHPKWYKFRTKIGLRRLILNGVRRLSRQQN